MTEGQDLKRGALGGGVAAGSHMGGDGQGWGQHPAGSPPPHFRAQLSPCGPTGETLPFGGAACGTRGNPREGNQAASLNPNFMHMP